MEQGIHKQTNFKLHIVPACMIPGKFLLDLLNRQSIFQPNSLKGSCRHFIILTQANLQFAGNAFISGNKRRVIDKAGMSASGDGFRWTSIE